MLIEEFEIILKLYDLKLCGLKLETKSESTGIPTVCLHGWLDNAGSFVPFMQSILESNEGRDHQIYAFDLPGHGKSDNLPKIGSYLMVDVAKWVASALDQLNIEKYNLVGHSMGGPIAIILANTDSRVQKLAIVDSLGPIPQKSSTSVDGLKITISKQRQKLQNLERKNSVSKRLYDSFDMAAKARMESTDLSMELALILSQRAVVQNTSGSFTWSYDRRLREPSNQRFSLEQVTELAKEIPCPTLLLQSKVSEFFDPDVYKALLKAFSKAESKSFDLGHHLHMEEPKLVSDHIQRFFNKEQEPAKSAS